VGLRTPVETAVNEAAYSKKIDMLMKFINNAL
jgi:hypothetical protein